MSNLVSFNSRVVFNKFTNTYLVTLLTLFSKIFKKGITSNIFLNLFSFLKKSLTQQFYFKRTNSIKHNLFYFSTSYTRRRGLIFKNNSFNTNLYTTSNKISFIKKISKSKSKYFKNNILFFNAFHILLNKNLNLYMLLLSGVIRKGLKNRWFNSLNKFLWSIACSLKIPARFFFLKLFLLLKVPGEMRYSQKGKKYSAIPFKISLARSLKLSIKLLFNFLRLTLNKVGLFQKFMQEIKLLFLKKGLSTIKEEDEDNVSTVVKPEFGLQIIRLNNKDQREYYDKLFKKSSKTSITENKRPVPKNLTDVFIFNNTELYENRSKLHYRW